MKKLLTPLSVLLAFAILIFSCSKDNPQPAASTGKISGTVKDASSASVLTNVTVILFDASNNSPVATTTSNTSGVFTFDIAGGNYFVKLYKQGYLPVPALGTTAIPFAVTVGQTSTEDAQMTASSATNAGYISGKITSGSTALGGVLVAAEATGVAYTGISDKDGNYSIFNVSAGSYQVKGYIANYTAASVAASVTSSTETANVNISMTSGVTGTVSGTMNTIAGTTIATPPTNMDISLVHPITKETIPGLSQSVTYSSSLTFSFSKVPDGNYIVRASYANDYIIMDPDHIAKFGDYTVSLSGGTPNPSTVGITATGAVLLNSPTNAMTTTVPTSASSTPTFTWSAYPSTSDYVIEVMDAATGNIVWGGFSNFGTSSVTKNITIASSTTSIAYNSDGKASIASLVSGKVYRWRIYASKNQVAAPGWGLIGASEDQMGLIKIN